MLFIMARFLVRLVSVNPGSTAVTATPLSGGYFFVFIGDCTLRTVNLNFIWRNILYKLSSAASPLRSNRNKLCTVMIP